MERLIILIMALTIILLTMFLVGCAGEEEQVPTLTAIDAALEGLDSINAPPESQTDEVIENNEQESVESHESPIPTPPPPPTEEEINRFEGAVDLLNLPFEVPSVHVYGMETPILNIYDEELIEWNPYIEFNIFLLDLIEGHWRTAVLPEEIAVEEPDFQWHEYLFTKNLTTRPHGVGSYVYQGLVWYEMSRFERNTGIEQTGSFLGHALLQPEYNRVKLIIDIRLDDHVSLVGQVGTFTETITWHFYFDNLNMAVGHFGFGERDPITDRVIRPFPVGYTRIG